MTIVLSASVGLGGSNKPEEVRQVRQQLNAHFARVNSLPQIAQNTMVNEELYKAIRIFQFAMGIKAPDSVISPGGRTLKTLNTAPEVYKLEGRTIRGHQEGLPGNVQKRDLVNTKAVSHDQSTAWAYDVAKDDFPVNSNKCNKFVYDVIKEAGLDAYVTIRGAKRAPLAAEWADKNTYIPNWRVLSTDEKPAKGDVAAYPLSSGGSSYSGHTGFIVFLNGTLTNISAHGTSVYPTVGQFENNIDTRYRRYIGA